LRPLLAGLEPAGASPSARDDPFELDARLRRALRLEQRLEAELGPLLRQVSAREYEWKAGSASLAAFALERLDTEEEASLLRYWVVRAGDGCTALRAA